MSCYEPLKGFVIGITKNNRPFMKILPYQYKWIDKKGIAYTTPSPGDDDVLTDKFMEVPCGHCLGCRSDQSKEWASRLIMEMQYHDSAYFVTLTYDDLHINMVNYVDPETGIVDWNPTLVKKDVQLFIKLLRYNFPDDKIRYYIAGEYGDKTNRPHYHAILFGLHLKDLVKCGRSETGNIYYTSKSIEDIWKKGFVSVEPANYATCKYTASYVTKKIGIKPNKVYQDKGIVPPFSVSSRKPGIGYNYLIDHIDEFYDQNDIRIGMIDGSYKITLPRYFKKKMRDIDEDRYEIFSRRREEAALDNKEAILERTNLSWQEYCEVKKKNHEQKLKQRNKI